MRAGQSVGGLRNCARRAKGFSIVEILTVLAIISVVMSMLVPTLGTFSSTAGRRAAVITVMNVFEQARVAALESGGPVYVIFHRRIFPDRDALLVLRAPTDGSSIQYEPLTRWIKLPGGILLHQPDAGQSLLSVTNFSGVFDTARMPVPPVLASGESLNVLVFNESGSVTFPATKGNRKLILSEGVRGENGTESILSQRKQDAAGFEIIALSPYTGRAQLEVTTIP